MRPSRLVRSLRVRLALLGFLAIYVPALLLFGVTTVTEDEETRVENGTEVTAAASDRDLSWTAWTVIALGPVAAGLAWWLAGRAVRPIERVRAVAEEIEGTDLSRRIGLDSGPTEVVALAAGFDAMLDRLERSADTQRRLLDEASHELRTPLAVLSTNADVLLSHPEPTLALYREGLERSKAAADRMLTTIDDLLVDARGRARALHRQPADLVTLVEGVVSDARVVAKPRDVELVVAAPDSVEATVDEAMTRRAIANLVDNAIRHAPDGSTVEITIEGTDTEATVAVTDHGPGIPPDQQERVFERFWRGGSGGASGLGLPIARQIADAHGGEVRLQSPGPAGDGCVFTLRLRR